MDSQTILKNFQENSKGILDEFLAEIRSVRTGRPNTLLLEQIKIDCYGQQTPLKHLASLSVIPPNAVLIEPWDKSILDNIKKAIEQSSLGITPQKENNQIKIYFPPLTQERKNELIKFVGGIKEKYRIKLRKLREEILEEIESAFQKKELSEDEKFRLKEEIQKLLDKTNKELDDYEDKKIIEIQNS